MPVQIPRLQRVQSSQQLPERRIRATVKSQAGDILSRTETLGKLAETGLDIYEKVENEKIDQLGNEIEQEYSVWNAEQMEKLKSFKGDPTDSYAQYEVEETEKYNELLGKREGLSERVKRGLKSRLDKVKSSARIQLLHQRGAQQATYENNLYESTLGLKKQGLPASASLIRPDVPESYGDFDKNIGEIKTIIAKHGLKNGTVSLVDKDAKGDHAYFDADGNVVKVAFSNQAKLRAGKEVSEGVKNSIDAVIAGGYKENAKAMLEKYKNYLDPKSRTDLLKKIKKEDVKEDAFESVGKIEAMPEDKRSSAIEKIKDPEKKSEVLKIMAANESRRAALRKGREDRNHEALSNHLIENRNKFHGIADLERDPIYKATWDKLSAKQKKAIEEEFKAPRKSDLKALARVQELFLGNDPKYKIETMSAAQFQEQLVGLNQGDRDKMNTRFLSRRTKKGEGRVSDRVYQQASKMLKNKLVGRGLVSLNDYNKLEKDDLIKFNQASDDLNNWLDGFDERATRKDISDYVDDYIHQKIKEDLFDPDERYEEETGEGFFFGPSKKYTPKYQKGVVTKKSIDPLEGLSARDITKLWIKYKRKFGKTGAPNAKDQAFLNFVNESK